MLISETGGIFQINFSGMKIPYNKMQICNLITSQLSFQNQKERCILESLININPSSHGRIFGPDTPLQTIIEGSAF